MTRPVNSSVLPLPSNTAGRCPPSTTLDACLPVLQEHVRAYQQKRGVREIRMTLRWRDFCSNMAKTAPPEVYPPSEVGLRVGWPLDFTESTSQLSVVWQGKSQTS